MLQNVKSTVKNSVIYGLGNLSTKVVGIILLPLYTKQLTKSEYGTLSILEVTSQALIVVFGLCLYQAFFRWYWQKEFISRQKSMFFTFITTLSAIAILLVLGLFPFLKSFSVLLFDHPNLSHILFLMLISAGIDIINSAPNTLIRLQEKPILFTTANIIKLIISLTLTIIFIRFFGKKIDGIYTAQIIGQLAYLLILSRYIKKNSAPIFEFQILKDMLKFSFPLILSAISILVLSLADRYILKFIGSLSDVGIYSVGLKMANTLQVFIVTSVSLAISPMIYKMMDAPNNKRFYSKLMTYYLYGLMICVIGMSVFGKEVVKIMAVKDYWDAYKVIPIFSFSIAFMALRDIALTGLLIKKNTSVMAKTVVFVSVLSIGLNILFITLFKSIGGALASLVSQGVYFFIILYAAQKSYFIPYEIKKIITVFILGILLVLLASLSNDLSIVMRLLIKSALIIVFPFILYPLGFYEDSELNAINGFWQKWKNPVRWKENIANFEWNL